MDLPPVLGQAARSTAVEDEDVVPAESLPPLHRFQAEVYGKLRKLLGGATGRAGLLSLPTGAGKTRVCVEAICDHLASTAISGGERDVVLWISQGEELQVQAWECFRQVWQVPPQRASKELPVHRQVPLRILRLWGGRRSSEIKFADGPHILVAGIDQLASWARTQPYWYLSFPRSRLLCVVVDEAHSLITREHGQVLSELGLKARHRWKTLRNAPPLIGLTATPWRSDEEEAQRLRNYFRRNLLRPPALGDDPVGKLQKSGFLSRIDYRRLPVQGTPKMSAKQESRFRKFKDLPLDYIKLLGRYDERNGVILRELAKLGPRRRAIIFACSIEHAETLAISLNRMLGEGSAAAITSHTPRSERAVLVARFRQREGLRFLVNVGVLAFGFDAPNADAVFVTRPTTSALRYEQMVGRGLRGPRNGGTVKCLVVDVQDEGLPDSIQSYRRVISLWRA